MATVTSSGHDTLIVWKDLKPWMEDNQYIRTRYRQPSFSIWSCIRSILQLHNESGNIWSHLLATFWFLRSMLSFHRTPGVEKLHQCDKWAVCIYYLVVINCFASSAIFHVCSNHSKEVHALWNELDYLGIVLVNWGSAIPSTYFAMYDAPKPYRYLHYVLICTFAAVSATITLQAKFRQPTYRRRRVFLFIFLGISTFLPVLQGLQMYGFQELNQRMSLMSFVGLAMWNLGGGLIYASRIPERWCPGYFDVFGSSHQIMHVLAVCGAYAGEQGILGALQYWASKQS